MKLKQKTYATAISKERLWSSTNAGRGTSMLDYMETFDQPRPPKERHTKAKSMQRWWEILSRR